MSTENEDSKARSGFTDGESNLLICMLKHLQGDIQTDFDAVAVEMGYKNAGIARTRWNQIKRKKIATGAVEKVSPIKKRAAKMVDSGHEDNDGNDGNDDKIVTPKKQKRVPKSAAKKESGSEEEGSMSPKEENEDDDDDQKD